MNGRQNNNEMFQNNSCIFWLTKDDCKSTYHILNIFVFSTFKQKFLDRKKKKLKKTEKSMMVCVFCFLSKRTNEGRNDINKIFIHILIFSEQSPTSPPPE